MLEQHRALYVIEHEDGWIELTTKIGSGLVKEDRLIAEFYSNLTSGYCEYWQFSGHIEDTRISRIAEIPIWSTLEDVIATND